MGKVMLVIVCLVGCSPSACLKMFRVMYYRFCANRWIQLMHCIRSFIRSGFYLTFWKKKKKLREGSRSLVKFTQVICARSGPGFSFPDSHDQASSITVQYLSARAMHALTIQQLSWSFYLMPKARETQAGRQTACSRWLRAIFPNSMLTLSVLVCMQLITSFQIFGCKNRACVAIGHGFFWDSEDLWAVVIFCEL